MRKRKTPEKLFPGVTEGRRRNMRANRSKDTKPELMVRRKLHAMGYRFRLHGAKLPGKPDIVFPARKKAIEVYGCFWHGHGCSGIGQLPKSRPEYWLPKIASNRDRDARNIRNLKKMGWRVLVLWECEVRRGVEKLQHRVAKFLD